MSKTQCYSCNEHGHMANQCKKKFCNCYKVGHLIAGCRRPQNRTNWALRTATAVTPTEPGPASHDTTALAPKLVQQRILSTFSAIALTVNNKTSSILYIDSGASNHLTSSAELTNVKPYTGKLQIHTADGECLPIKTIGDLPHTLPLHHVFLHTSSIVQSYICWSIS